MPNEILSACQVVNVSSVEIALAMSSPTAANHARYMMESCIQALRTYDQRFCQLQSIKADCLIKEQLSIKLWCNQTLAQIDF